MFIVFEGADGCGKSTQILKLLNFLYNLSKYNSILITREPFKSREIRNILKQDNNPYSQIQRLTELYIQDRKEHLAEMILPALQRNIIVISDRYKYSTICYQSAQGQDMAELIEAHKNMPAPDYVFIVDTPVEITFGRMSEDLNSREAKHKFEKNREFQEKVRQNYLKMPGIFPNEKIIILDGTKSIPEIFSDIKKHLFPLQNL